MICYLESMKLLNFILLKQVLQLLLSDRAGPGRPRVGPGSGQVRCLGPDPMRAGPTHQNSGPALALLGSGRVDPRANRARPCPWTV
jgi:hypothetical protein